jgi:O-antigen/teichoic acid export membrane protein
MSEPSAPDASGGDWALADEHRGSRRRTARGMLLLTVTSGFYIASAYAITVWLAHHLGPSDFGRYGVATAIITLVSIAVARGVPVAAARAIAAEPCAADQTMAAGARAMVALVLAVAVLTAFAAIPVAAALGDDALRVPLLIGAGAALTYGLQALPLAWFTGMHRYARQGLAQTWYAASRLGTIIVGGLLGGLTGAIAGFVAAPAIAALATVQGLGARQGDRLSSTSRTPSASALTARALLRASVPLVGVAALVSGLLTIDLLAFKRVGTPADAGRYAAAATIAHVPFFLLRSVPLVLMPAVSAARAAEPQAVVARFERVRQEIRRGVGDAIVLLALPTALLVALGDRALELVFGADYELEKLVVAPLALATAAITLYTVLVAVETALGTLRVALAAGVLGLALVAAAAAIGGQGSNPSRAAWAVGAAAALTFVVHAASVWRRVGWFVPARAVAAVGLAAAVGATTLAAPPGGVWFATSAGAACAAYAAIALRAGLVHLR